MVIPVTNRPRRTNEAATETADTILENSNFCFAGCDIKGETVGWAYVQAKLTAAACLVMYCHLKHLSSSEVLELFDHFPALPLPWPSDQWRGWNKPDRDHSNALQTQGRLTFFRLPRSP